MYWFYFIRSYLWEERTQYLDLTTKILLNYKEMLLETLIYIGYVGISIMLYTSMLAIELFYLTQPRSFLGYFFGYLPLLLPFRFAVNP